MLGWLFVGACLTVLAFLIRRKIAHLRRWNEVHRG